MQDLKDVTQDTHYENFRAKKLASGELAPNVSNMSKLSIDESSSNNSSRNNSTVDNRDALLMEKDEELKRMQEMIAKMQASMLQQQKVEG
jgi:septin family protein